MDYSSSFLTEGLFRCCMSDKSGICDERMMFTWNLMGQCLDCILPMATSLLFGSNAPYFQVLSSPLAKFSIWLWFSITLVLESVFCRLWGSIDRAPGSNPLSCGWRPKFPWRDLFFHHILLLFCKCWIVLKCRWIVRLCVSFMLLGVVFDGW